MAKEEKGYWFSTENGTHIHAEEGESKEQAMGKRFKNFKKETSNKPELLSKEYFDKFYEEANGDEDKMLDLIRADEEYQKSFDDPNTTWSMGDLQGLVEVYMDKKTGKTMIERYREKLSKQYKR